MEQLNNLIARVKTRLKPILIQDYLHSRKVAAILSGVGLIISIPLGYLLDTIEKTTFIILPYIITFGTSAFFALFGLLFFIVFHVQYKKFLKKEWTSTVKNQGDIYLTEDAQQLNAEEIQELLNMALPPQLFRYIDNAVREKGFITHDDLYTMLQHEKDTMSAKNQYENFIQNITCDNSQQKQNLHQLLNVAGVNQNHKKFNSKNIL